MKQGVQLHVYGIVQGVGFRWTTKMVADKYQIKGFVKNNEDGSVSIEAVGEEDKLHLFIAQVKASPTPSGKVTAMDKVKLTELPDYTRFNVTG